MTANLTHLQRLEAEAIHVFREVAANFAKPVMLYSIGKDSSVLMHLAMKAFHPAVPPFDFLHVDTTWKFKEMIAFRDETARRLGIKLNVHINPEGLAQGINPIDHGSNTHTHIMKTVALRQALCAIEGVVAVEDLHVWTLTSGKDTLSAHVVVADPHPHPRMLRTVQALVRERFAIEHVTVQLEPQGFDEPRVPF